MNYIYLDNAATTRQHPEVTAEINRATNESFYNPAALYAPSLGVKKQIERARTIILNRLSPSGGGEVIFTSGATESNNMVIFSKSQKNGHVLLLDGEHSSAHNPVKFLKDSGFPVTHIPLNADGRIRTPALSGGDGLVIFGLVNSDTGTIQDAAGFVRDIRAKYPNAHIHCDATQAFCKIPFDANTLGFDSVAISAHKIGGPKGIGALWLKKGVNLRPMLYGGGQHPLRPGTENTTGILGFARAVEVFDTTTSWSHISNLHARLIMKLPQGCTVNGINNNPYITNISLPNVLGQTVMNALAIEGIIVGMGSACAASSNTNRTLQAMGMPPQKTRQVLRVSFSSENTVAHVDAFTTKLGDILTKL